PPFSITIIEDCPCLTNNSLHYTLFNIYYTIFIVTCSQNDLTQVEQEIHKAGFLNLELLSRQVVKGFISGLHKSPFHGFSAEFAEHKNYNRGESTRHLDWKLFARTDKLYTKKYEEETNL